MKRGGSAYCIKPWWGSQIGVRGQLQLNEELLEPLSLKLRKEGGSVLMQDSITLHQAAVADSAGHSLSTAASAAVGPYFAPHDRDKLLSTF